jgi:hypothetical protein
MVDDFGGYKASFKGGVTELACRAQARRKFFELPANGGHPVVEEALGNADLFSPAPTLNMTML